MTGEQRVERTNAGNARDWGTVTDERRRTHDGRLPRRCCGWFQLLSLRDQDRMHENAGGEGAEAS